MCRSDDVRRAAHEDVVSDGAELVQMTTGKHLLGCSIHADVLKQARYNMTVTRIIRVHLSKKAGSGQKLEVICTMWCALLETDTLQ